MNAIIEKVHLEGLKLFNPDEWEFYMKRNNRYYFRQVGRKLSFTLQGISKVKYGNYLLEIKKQ